MRKLYPDPMAEVDAADAYAADRARPDERPWLMLNMVASADGAAAIDGRSGGLGGPADRAVFSALRGLADVILVAAGTARAENYGPPHVSEATRRQRRTRGQTDAPRMALVTRSMDLELGSPLFTQAETPPLVLTAESAPPDRRTAASEVAEVVVLGQQSVDLERALVEIGRTGAAVVLAEGGPSLNGQLVAGDSIDELCLTVSPLLIGGDSLRIARGGHAMSRSLELAHVLTEDDLLFLRYVRSR